MKLEIISQFMREQRLKEIHMACPRADEKLELESKSRLLNFSSEEQHDFINCSYAWIIFKVTCYSILHSLQVCPFYCYIAPKQKL